MEHVFRLLGVEMQTGPAIICGGLILTRIFIVVNLIPFLFGNPTPQVVKSGVSLMLMIILYPLIRPTVPDGAFDNFLFVIALFLKEAFYGAAIGLSASMIFYGFDAAGQVIDNQRGASMAQIFSPQTGQQVTIFGSFTFQLSIVLFLTLGGHRLFLHAFVESYSWLPIYEMPADWPGLMGLMEHFIRISGQVLFIAAQLSAPVLISIFVVDLILGVMNRISPAINVLTLGFAIRGVMGVLIFFLSFTLVATQLKLLSMESVKHVRQTIIYLARGV